MSEPWGIVVVPTEAGRALTGELFPTWVTRNGSGASVWELCPARSPIVFHHTLERKGLPLWWGCALVPEGWDHFRRWAMDRSEVDHSDGHDACTRMYVRASDVLTAAAWAADTIGRCRVVVLDLVDGAVVERAP